METIKFSRMNPNAPILDPKQIQNAVVKVFSADLRDKETKYDINYTSR